MPASLLRTVKVCHVLGRCSSPRTASSPCGISYWQNVATSPSCSRGSWQFRAQLLYARGHPQEVAPWRNGNVYAQERGSDGIAHIARDTTRAGQRGGVRHSTCEVRRGRRDDSSNVSVAPLRGTAVGYNCFLRYLESCAVLSSTGVDCHILLLCRRLRRSYRLAGTHLPQGRKQHVARAMGTVRGRLWIW